MFGAFLTGLMCFSAGSATPPFQVEVVEAPQFVAVGGRFEIKVQYGVSADAGQWLNFELKTAANQVVSTVRTEVVGQGEQVAKLTAPDQPQQITVAVWIGTDWQKALSPIRHTQPIDVLTEVEATKQRARLEEHRVAAKAFTDRIGPKPEERYSIALLKASLPGHDPAEADELLGLLRGDKQEVQVIDADLLCNPLAMTADRFDLLVLPAAGSLPADGVSVIKQFLARGGDLMALGAPAFCDPLWKSGDRWLSREQWRQMLLDQRTEHIVFDFDQEDLNQWNRNTNTPEHGFQKELTDGPQGKALHVHIDKMAGWDGVQSPGLTNPFPAEHSLTCFYAKGSGRTRTLSLEWQEKDGSRWIAVFPVTDQWQRYALTPSDFAFWQSVPHRGFRGDRFNPKNAVRLQIIVAYTHTGPRGGEYDFAVDQIGTAPNPHGDVPSAMLKVPPVEGICPRYKFYDLTEVTKVRCRVPWAGMESLPVPTGMQGHHPRPTGKGFNRGRSWRWLPLLDAIGGQNQWRGAPAGMFADFEGTNQFSIRTAFSVADRNWYRQGSVRQFLANCVARMADGVFFQEAGSEFYTYRPGEPVLLGARIGNLSRQNREGMQLRYELRRGGGTEPVMTINKPVSVSPGHVETVSHNVNLPEEGDKFTLTVQLRQADRIIDEVTHEIAVFRPKPAEQRRFMTVRDGDFVLDAKKWYAHGVNYMPSTGIGIEDWAYFEHWMGSRSYDPEFIQRDLERCRDMGLNTVSIFIGTPSLAGNNLLDILRRCEELGLKVNLSIRPGTPMDYKWEWWEGIIRPNRLWEIDTIYAYDIAWEPFFGTPPQRRTYDPQWREWIAAKYGSPAAAESAWGVPAPRHEGQVSTPTVEHLGRDGSHRKMVADYRRFVDELIHQKYQAAADQIRTVDNNHLISFRMTVTGDPTFDGGENMPYDFRGVARSMDFMAPEGYGRIGDWSRVRDGMFTVTYARHCAPGKPVLWAEAGVSAWDMQSMQAPPAQLAFQGEFYENFYRMVVQSFSNGVVWWWYPGGLRVNENSDFGIINPDGTDRPVTRVIRRFAGQILAERTIPKPTMTIDIDRDSDARGLFGIYEQVRDRYWKAIESGQVPGLQARPAP